MLSPGVMVRREHGRRRIVDEQRAVLGTSAPLALRFAADWLWILRFEGPQSADSTAARRRAGQASFSAGWPRSRAAAKSTKARTLAAAWRPSGYTRCTGTGGGSN